MATMEMEKVQSPMALLQSALAGHVVRGELLGDAVRQVEANLRKVNSFGGAYADISLSEDMMALIAQIKYTRKAAFVRYTLYTLGVNLVQRQSLRDPYLQF